MKLFLLLLALNANAQSSDPWDRVAQTAEIMLDGDVAKRVQTPRSARKLLEVDPHDPWQAADNYDVNDAAFIQMKKTLMRLARLCPAVCDVNLWIPVPAPGKPRIQILVRNVNEMSQFWNWGDLHQPMPAEMQQVLDTGRRLTVRNKPGMTSVLAPVRDSLGDVVAIAEVVTRAIFDPRENVK